MEEVVPVVNGGAVSFANGELAGKNHLVLSATRTTMYFFVYWFFFGRYLGK